MTKSKRRLATLAMIATLALFGVVSGFLFPTSALAWDNCPKGLVNDPYPGRCGRYTDTNSDGICDLSQPQPVASTTTTTKPNDTTTTTVAVATTTTSGEPPTGDCPLGPCSGCGACLSIGAVSASASQTDIASGAAVAGAALAVSSNSTTTSTTPPASGANTASTGSGSFSLFTHYNVSPIAIGFFLVYAVSFFLYKTKRIKTSVHRKVWNVLLLATFLITGIFGLILTIQLDYTLPFTIPFNLLFWHVEAGIVMTLISLFHIGWHFNYYRNLLRSGRKKVVAARELESVREAEDRRHAREERDRRRQERDRPRDHAPRRALNPESSPTISNLREQEDM
jgi:hypothetical protein